MKKYNKLISKKNFDTQILFISHLINLNHFPNNNDHFYGTIPFTLNKKKKKISMLLLNQGNHKIEFIKKNISNKLLNYYLFNFKINLKNIRIIFKELFNLLKILKKKLKKKKMI